MNKVIRFLFVVNHLAIKVVLFRLRSIQALFDKVLNTCTLYEVRSKVFPNIRKKYDYRLAAVFNFQAGLYGVMKEEIEKIEGK